MHVGIQQKEIIGARLIFSRNTGSHVMIATHVPENNWFWLKLKSSLPSLFLSNLAWVLSTHDAKSTVSINDFYLFTRAFTLSIIMATLWRQLLKWRPVRWWPRPLWYDNHYTFWCFNWLARAGDANWSSIFEIKIKTQTTKNYLNYNKNNTVEYFFIFHFHDCC